MDQLKTTLCIDLHAIHVHHGLSLNADAWAIFCTDFCIARNIALTIRHVHVEQQSPAGLEGAARAARYAAFEEECSPYILLAQHADDQAETVLHQLLRGTGLKGLAGMGEVRIISNVQSIFRPLLGVSRANIEATAHERGLKWIDDGGGTLCQRIQ